MDATIKNKKENSGIFSLFELQLSRNPLLNKINLGDSNQIIIGCRKAITKKHILQAISIILTTHQILLTN